MATLAEPQLIDLRRYITAGRATFTLVSRKTGERFTYKVTQREDSPHFVKLRQGPEYDFLGSIFKDGQYGHGRRSRIDQQTKGAVAFEWFWNKIDSPKGNGTDRVRPERPVLPLWARVDRSR